MSLFWFILGALVTLAIGFVYFLHTSRKFNVLSWLLAIGTVLMGAFTIAWSVASIAENEMQAAGMGVLIFGGITIVMILITRKLIVVNKAQ